MALISLWLLVMIKLAKFGVLKIGVKRRFMKIKIAKSLASIWLKIASKIFNIRYMATTTMDREWMFWTKKTDMEIENW